MVQFKDTDQCVYGVGVFGVNAFTYWALFNAEKNFSFDIVGLSYP